MKQTLLIEQLAEAGVKLTPMMEQYHSIKKNYKEEILLFRMGDFYEVFFEDAQLVAKLLNITLTTRGKLGDTSIPMAGIPHHAAKNYLDRITQQGYKAAICEQVENPKNAKGIVKRAVTQVISPGIPFDIESQSQLESFFIASAQGNEKEKYSLSLIDYTTGDFFGHTQLDRQELLEKINLYQLKEFICYAGQWEEFPELTQSLEQTKVLISFCSPDYFNLKFQGHLLKKTLPQYQKDKTIGQHRKLLSSITALVSYINAGQQEIQLDHLKAFRLINDRENLNVSLSTLQGLEIWPRTRDQESNSLIYYMDQSITSMGSRYLKAQFQRPLYSKQKILERQEFVSSLLRDEQSLLQLREQLDLFYDLDRLLSKIAMGKTVAQNLVQLSKSVYAGIETEKVLKKFKVFKNDFLFSSKNTSRLLHMAEYIADAITEEISASIEKGNLIRHGFDKKRDRLADLTNNARSEFDKLETYYRKKTQINNLKIKYNNINGYFIEISKSQLDKVPSHFNRFQTLTNSERYQTKKLKELENEVVLAQEKLRKFDQKIFDHCHDLVIESLDALKYLSGQIAKCDFYQSLAWIALTQDFTKPTLVDQKTFEAEGMWHPLIKKVKMQDFVPHSISLGKSKHLALITGPNMSGKTTVMREVAIVQFLAQIGSFVPAMKVRLSLCDYLFSRLGASDDIVQGQSTFMVEMAETSEILRHASERSLILLDEIGRGTSTFDGISIAWALIEYLVSKVKAITLFSSHYHELIKLVDNMEHAENFNVKTLQKNGEIKFLYELTKGGATQSFGIHVAKLAGLPKSILNRSQEILGDLEKEGQSLNHLEDTEKPEDITQLSLFGQTTDTNTKKDDARIEKLNRISEDMAEIDLQNITPITALNKLDQYKTILLQ
jgi:DNA mismatch repair protein MutS